MQIYDEETEKWLLQDIAIWPTENSGEKVIFHLGVTKISFFFNHPEISPVMTATIHVSIFAFWLVSQSTGPCNFSRFNRFNLLIIKLLVCFFGVSNFMEFKFLCQSHANFYLP